MSHSIFLGKRRAATARVLSAILSVLLAFLLSMLLMSGLAGANKAVSAMQPAPEPSACPEDVRGRPNVDIIDIQLAAASWNGEPLLPEQDGQDLDGDGLISLWEIQAIANAWRNDCDGRLLAYAQEFQNGARRILLRWRISGDEAGPGDVFDIYRRTDSSPQWARHAQTGFAANADEMSAILGQELLNQLALDLRTDESGQPTDEGDPLSPAQIYDLLRTDRGRAGILADRYHQVALAVGAGFLDENVPAGENVEYYVVRAGTDWPRFGPLTVDPNAALPAPLNLRESAIYDGPADLGILPSPRPYTATERYDPSVYDTGRHVDGRAFLIWELPGRDQSGPLTYTIAGYHVYRRGPATDNQWQIANPPNGIGGYELVEPAVYAEEAFSDEGVDGDNVDDDFFFRDDLKDVFADTIAVDPSRVYTDWDYRVCPVDMLGNESSNCSEVTVKVRELDPPAPVRDLQVSVDADHTELRLTWRYSDTHEISPPLHFFVTRSPTATLPITLWTELSPDGIQAPVASPTVTLTLTDTPPMGTSFWYRVQVRDNAGNWSGVGIMRTGALHDRIPPDFGPIPHDAETCANNNLPLILENLDEEIREIVLYAAFNPDGPWHIIERIPVENRRAVIDDDYQPPRTTDVYYRLEAVDGHGNVSDGQSYCTWIDPGNTPERPRVEVSIEDPTVVTKVLNPDADAQVNSGYKNISYGDDSTMMVGNKDKSIYRSFIHFDLSEALADVGFVQRATLRLYKKDVHGNGEHDIEVYRALAAWNEGLITWNNQPARVATGRRIASSNDWFEWDVTPLVQIWLDGGANNGLALLAITEADEVAHEFNTRENFPQDRPQLVVTYTVPGRVTVNFGEPSGGGTETVVYDTRPGPDGNTTTMMTTTLGSAEFPVEPGETVVFTVANGEGPPAYERVRNVNNFLDTNRHMANAGPIFGLEWRFDEPDPAVRIHFKYEHRDPPRPLVAAFRQIPNGSWMQVTPVQAIDPINIGRFNDEDTLYITDVADLSSDQAYNYAVLGFSPTSYEVLGYWETTPLAAWQDAPEYITLSDPLGPAPEFPDCDFELKPPDSFGWYIPVIELYNNWSIQVRRYRDFQNCGGIVTDPDHLYGRGWLRDGAGQSWPIDFVDIAADEATGRHTQGRILLDGDGLNVSENGGGLWFDIHYGRIEFRPDEANAEVIIGLPENIKVVHPAQAGRSNRFLGVVGNVRTSLKFDPLAVIINSQCDEDDPGGLYLLDEHLPWRLYARSMQFGYNAVTLMDTACTRDRLGYEAPSLLLGEPDNNLGFMRPEYTSENAQITPGGLQGDFATGFTLSDAFSYVTSLPAGVGINAMSGANVTITDSHIKSGGLYKARLGLDYFDKGTDLSYMRAGGLVAQGYLVDKNGDGVVPGTSIHRMAVMRPQGDDWLSIGRNGILSDTVILYPAAGEDPDTVQWPGFEALIDSDWATFYAAAAAFEDAPAEERGEPEAPMPAENAWRQLLGPFNGDVDPGVNIIRLDDDDEIRYACYDPGRFDDADMDLYVRRGGVSENLRINAGPGRVTDEDGYQMTMRKFDVIFVDNVIVVPDVLLDLFLPYPSEVTIELEEIVMDPEKNCPDGGSIVPPVPTLLHKYWNFEFTPNEEGISWYKAERQEYYLDQYVANDGDRNQAPIPAKIFTILGRGTVNGLGQNANTLEQVDDFVTMDMAAEWLPDGDYGDIRVQPDEIEYLRVSGVPYRLRDVKLSHYYSQLLDPNTSPDTLGLEQDLTMQELPAHLRDASGEVTPQSLKDCSDGNAVGCGFVLLDGDGAVEYFGEIRKRAGSNDGQFSGDEPEGAWPVAVNYRLTATPPVFQALTEQPILNWAWPFEQDDLAVAGQPTLSGARLSQAPAPPPISFPCAFQGNMAGGALACVLRNAQIPPVPGADVLRSDIAVVATYTFVPIPPGFQGEIGIFLGHTASQAAFRALAMHRPNAAGTPGFKPFANWGDVEDDIQQWAVNFGYALQAGGGNDPVDLARETWDRWGAVLDDCSIAPAQGNSFDKAYCVLESHIRQRAIWAAFLGGSSDIYGIAGVQSGTVLRKAGVTLRSGLGQAIFSVAASVTGPNYNLEEIRFGIQMDGQLPGSEFVLLRVGWASMLLNKDKEYRIEGSDVSVGLLPFGPSSYRIPVATMDVFFLVGTQQGYERVEGFIDGKDERLELNDLIGLEEFSFLYGSGQYEGEPFAYLGGDANFNWLGVVFGVELVIGDINPNNEVLQQAALSMRFAHLLRKWGEDSSSGRFGVPYYHGWYLALSFGYSFGPPPPLPTTCLLDGRLTGELRAWSFERGYDEDQVWGGYVGGDLHGEIACLLSFRGSVYLVLEAVGSGDLSQGGRRCRADPFLFSVGLEFQSDLEQGALSEGLRQEFENHGISLSDNISITTKVGGSQWLIHDRGVDPELPGRKYIVIKTGGALDIYEDLGSCIALTGAFWVAKGFGWCEPRKWRSWESRWWGDSWCYTFGAYVDLTYIHQDGWDADVEVDWE